MITLGFLNHKQGQIISDPASVNVIREKFSIKNPAYGRGNKFAAARIYAITPSGKFDIGLCDVICAYLDANQIKYQVDPNLLKIVNVGFNSSEIKTYSNLAYREHQEKSIKMAVKKGRGVVVIPTAGGKTLIMAGMIETMRQKLNDPDALALVLVPSIQLVEQTSKDFESYGLTKVTKWSGKNIPDSDATTIVVSNQILLSEKSDVSILNDVKILLVDETHGLRRGNEINKIFELIKTHHRFGFTGTMPSSPIDQWNIMGKLGPIVYEEKTKDLRQKNFVSDFNIMILNIKHEKPPTFTSNLVRPAEAYNYELEYLLSNNRRNEIIAKLASRLNENTIIMVDRIEHGENIKEMLLKICDKDRPVYFIQGSTEMEDREQVRKLMESRNDIIAVAVSKIFSTGINIPNLHNIIFASAGKAKIKIMQSIGRALRLHPTKKMATIFDIADNTKYSKIHLAERIKLYTTENYKYEKTEI
jgi:superfamily II DNA or RNA helicase